MASGWAPTGRSPVSPAVGPGDRTSWVPRELGENPGGEASREIKCEAGVGLRWEAKWALQVALRGNWKGK